MNNQLMKAPSYTFLDLDAYAELGFVRNSCGADSYVSDEIITAHSGQRVSVGNTDAEGRMVLADCLSHCREKALAGSMFSLLVLHSTRSLRVFPLKPETDSVPRLMTMCTLTGHAALSVGPYAITLDNGVAKRERQSLTLQDYGEIWGDPLEVYTFLM